MGSFLNTSASSSMQSDVLVITARRLLQLTLEVWEIETVYLVEPLARTGVELCLQRLSE